MTNESWIPVPSRPTPLATTENLPPIRSHRTFKTYPYQIGTQRKRSCKTNFNKKFIFFIRVVFNGPPPLPQLGLWTFEPAFSPRFSFPLSPRSFFHTRQRFPISNHVTSGCMSPRSSLDHWSAVSHTGNDMTSLICSRPIRSQHLSQTSAMYY